MFKTGTKVFPGCFADAAKKTPIGSKKQLPARFLHCTVIPGSCDGWCGCMADPVNGNSMGKGFTLDDQNKVMAGVVKAYGEDKVYASSVQEGTQGILGHHDTRCSEHERSTLLDETPTGYPWAQLNKDIQSGKVGPAHYLSLIERDITWSVKANAPGREPPDFWRTSWEDYETKHARTGDVVLQGSSVPGDPANLMIQGTSHMPICHASMTVVFSMDPVKAKQAPAAGIEVPGGGGPSNPLLDRVAGAGGLQPGRSCGFKLHRNIQDCIKAVGPGQTSMRHESYMPEAKAGERCYVHFVETTGHPYRNTITGVIANAVDVNNVDEMNGALQFIDPLLKIANGPYDQIAVQQVDEHVFGPDNPNGPNNDRRPIKLRRLENVLQVLTAIQPTYLSGTEIAQNILASLSMGILDVSELKQDHVDVPIAGGWLKTGPISKLLGFTWFDALNMQLTKVYGKKHTAERKAAWERGFSVKAEQPAAPAAANGKAAAQKQQQQQQNGFLTHQRRTTLTMLRFFCSDFIAFIFSAVFNAQGVSPLKSALPFDLIAPAYPKGYRVDVRNDARGIVSPEELAITGAGGPNNKPRPLSELFEKRQRGNTTRHKFLTILPDPGQKWPFPSKVRISNAVERDARFPHAEAKREVVSPRCFASVCEAACSGLNDKDLWGGSPAGDASVVQGWRREFIKGLRMAKDPTKGQPGKGARTGCPCAFKIEDNL
eukprot:g3632.t1